MENVKRNEAEMVESRLCGRCTTHNELLLAFVVEPNLVAISADINTHHVLLPLINTGDMSQRYSVKT